MDNSRFLHMHRMWIAASQVKALLWTRLAAESPAFPPCVHRLGRLFAQVIHMLMHRNPVSRLPAGTPGAGVPVPGWSPRGRTRAPGPELDGVGCETGAGSRLRPLVHGRLRTAPVLTSAVPAAPGAAAAWSGMVRIVTVGILATVGLSHRAWSRRCCRTRDQTRAPCRPALGAGRTVT